MIVGHLGARPSLPRFAALATVAVLVIFGAAEAWIILGGALLNPDITLGLDLRMYLERAAAWLAGDGFYLPRQLTGEPYVLQHGDVLYPPVFLYLLVPFTVLPAPLWWLVPAIVVGWVLIRMRPSVGAWPLLALVLCYPRTWMVLLYGNPSMWVVAAVAAGTWWGWPSALALLKPTLAPFAIVGIRGRRWWLTATLIVLASIPLADLWPQYLAALTNARNPFGIEYILGEWPIVAAFLVARAFSTARPVAIAPVLLPLSSRGTH